MHIEQAHYKPASVFEKMIQHKVDAFWKQNYETWFKFYENDLYDGGIV